jgi:sugar diacid utilization regulator
VTSIRELVQSPTLARRLVYLVRPEVDPAVQHVALVEDLSEVTRVNEHAIVLVSRAGSANAGRFGLDIALRLARKRSVAALVLPGPAATAVTQTSAHIANRSGTAILATGRDADLAELAVAIGRELAGEAEVALLRAHTALRSIEAHPRLGRPQEIAEHAGNALGVRIEMVSTAPALGPSAPIIVDEQLEGWLVAEPQEGDMAMGLDIVLHAAAAAASRAFDQRRRAEGLPIESREEVLSELLASPPQGRAGLVHRARTLGVPIDGWHNAVRLELEASAALSSEDEFVAYQSRLRLARLALKEVQDTGGQWHGARAGTALLLICMHESDPGSTASGAVAKTMDAVLARVRAELRVPLIRCGVGGAHVGPDGLLASAAEARAAVIAAGTSGRPNTALAFDSVGLRRTLVEWYASETAQAAVSTVLAPLTKLDPSRGDRLIRTLHVYLDHQGSLTKTAELLNLHRNAVAYRINQVFELLDVDQGNPDDMLLLQLACRARELA